MGRKGVSCLVRYTGVMGNETSLSRGSPQDGKAGLFPLCPTLAHDGRCPPVQFLGFALRCLQQ
jgi:hypothetical protein